MNRKLNAVALANQHLRRENEELWKRNETVERGAEEMEAMYRAMIMQIVMQMPLKLDNDDPLHQTLYQVYLPKIDVKEMMQKYELVAENWNTGLFLRVDERKEDKGEND